MKIFEIELNVRHATESKSVHWHANCLICLIALLIQPHSQLCGESLNGVEPNVCGVIMPSFLTVFTCSVAVHANGLLK